MEGEAETVVKDNVEMDESSSSSNKNKKKAPPGGAYHLQRNASMDSSGHLQNQHQQQQQAPYGRPPAGPPPDGSYRHQQQRHQQHPYGHYHQRSGGTSPYAYAPAHYQQHHQHHYPPHYVPRSGTGVPLVRSVVTHSFSMEEAEQREDRSSRYAHRQDAAAYTPREEYRSAEDAIQQQQQQSPQQQQQPYSSAKSKDSRFEPPPPPFEASPSASGGGGPPHPVHYSRDLPPVPEADETRMPPHDIVMRTSSRGSDGGRSVRIPPSPNGPPLPPPPPPPVQRSHSTGSYRNLGGGPPPPLKRSFWHHSRPYEHFETVLPQEFMPPKRSKVTPPRGYASSRSGHREYVVTARPMGDQFFARGRKHGSRNNNNNIVAMGSPTGSATGWGYTNGRTMSREDYSRRDPRWAPSWSSRSPTGQDALSNGSSWSEAPYMPSPRSRYEQGYSDIQSWGSPRGSWGIPGPEDNEYGQPPPHHNHHHPWPQDSRDVQSHHDNNKHTQEEREVYDDGVDVGGSNMGEGPFDDGGMHFTIRPTGVEFMAERSNVRGGGIHSHNCQSPQMMNTEFGVDNNMVGVDSNMERLKLLSLPEDKISLSETLCIIRENIEIFTASVEDVEAPAPGRKHAVTVGQVGLRCIHCRHTTRSSERVKRAVCYPSSIKRIYRTVIDMKLDHFHHCKFVPQTLKDTLTALKACNSRSTGTTMQYFMKAAAHLGMVDSPFGVRFSGDRCLPAKTMSPSPEDTTSSAIPKLLTPSSSERKKKVNSKRTIVTLNSADNAEFCIHRTSSLSSDGTPGNSVIVVDDANMPKETFAGNLSLALPEDKMSLSPLRCFLRQQVCAFTATEQDIAVRTPTTFSVSVGQVGIGCIHCMHHPAKMRLNRAACFPFSIGRIYQAVADIQRFHITECKDVPKDIKEKFLQLQSRSSKGSKGLATRQYWVTSAKKLGLADTSKGIRYIRDPAVPEKKAVSLDILAQVASHVTTVHRPLVLPEDKPFIAEFLYVVMEQLQPCRFTEADRNKRRIKDVGCIGVECKHCAGQVDGRKFFWSSVNAVESNFVSVHTHMGVCKKVPPELKEKLVELKALRKQQTGALPMGSQKNFFGRVWKRLHEGEAEQARQEKESRPKQPATAVVPNPFGQTLSPMDEGKVFKTPSRDDSERATMGEDMVMLSQAPMELTPTPTPTSSPTSMEKPMAEIKLKSDAKVQTVSDKIADITMSDFVPGDS